MGKLKEIIGNQRNPDAVLDALKRTLAPRARPLLVAAMFLLAGVLALAAGQAATFTAAQEAEGGAITGNAAALNGVAGASGTSSVRFGSGTTPPPVPGGRVIKVATDGSGQYYTFQEGVNAAQPGDTVEIGGGTYKQQLWVNKSGTAGKPITFMARAGQKVIIDAQNGLISGSSNGMINIENQSYLRFIGINVINSPAVAAWGVNVNHILFQNCEMSYIKHGGIVMINGSDVTVDSCDVHHTNQIQGTGTEAQHEPISFTNIDGFEIKNNKVHDNKEEGIDAKYDSRNGSIHHNQSYNNNGPNIYIDSAWNTKVYDNVVTTTLGATKSGIGLAIESYSTNKQCYGIDVYNNVVTGSKLAGVGFWVESTGSFHDIRIYNNTFNSNVYGLNFSTTPDKFTGANNIFRNNIVANSGNGGVNYESGTVPFTIDKNLFSTGTAQSMGTNPIVADPKFVNATGNDFHLQSGSPAIDAGSSATMATDDLDGKTRPRGSAVDVGAYEF